MGAEMLLDVGFFSMIRLVMKTEAPTKQMQTLLFARYII
jgi:hypothetical protein